MLQQQRNNRPNIKLPQFNWILELLHRIYVFEFNNLCSTCVHASSHGVGAHLTSEIHLNAGVDGRNLRILTDHRRLSHPTCITQHCVTTPPAQPISLYQHRPITARQNSSCLDQVLPPFVLFRSSPLRCHPLLLEVGHFNPAKVSGAMVANTFFGKFCG